VRPLPLSLWPALRRHGLALILLGLLAAGGPPPSVGSTAPIPRPVPQEAIVAAGVLPGLGNVYHMVEHPRAGVLLLSGVDGGVDGPHDGFYSRLAADLIPQGLAVLRVNYRAPGDLTLSVEDALAALDEMRAAGVEPIAVVGFSFGGAVAIETAVERPEVVSVALLSSQSLGTDRVPLIAPRPLLVIVAARDQTVPAWASDDIYERAGEPKRLIVLDSDDHYLHDTAEAVRQLLLHWFAETLLTADGGSETPPLSTPGQPLHLTL